MAVDPSLPLFRRLAKYNISFRYPQVPDLHQATTPLLHTLISVQVVPYLFLIWENYCNNVSSMILCT